MKTKICLIVAFAITVGATSVLGTPILSAIPTLTDDTTNSGRAITPDGQYVVGISGSRGFLYPVGSTSSVNVICGDNEAQSTQAVGVGYRTSDGNTEVIIAGMSSGYVTEWMTNDGGASFGSKRRNTSFGANIQSAYNALGSSLGSDTYYVSSRANNNTGTATYLGQGSGSWVATVVYMPKSPTDKMGMNSVGASGRTVGWRGTGTSVGACNNYMLTWVSSTASPAATYFPGLDGSNKGQAFSVSADGNTVFGASPTVGDSANHWGYKVVNPGASQTINALPVFGDEASSTSRQTPYGCSADGRYAVGMAYRGTEKAALWDTGDVDPANWTVLDLTEFATANGILGGWVRLTRAYSVGVDATGQPVITGQGAWSPDGGVTTYTRAFVLTLPEPATIGLLLAGLPLFRRRRR